MPQVFHVLQCFSCRMFQVHQVKKINKWACKLCGQKQSVIKVFGEGSGADCRKHVQKLNMMRSQVDTADQENWTSAAQVTSEEVDWNENISTGSEYLQVGSSAGVAESKWGKYVTEEDQEVQPGSDMEEEDVTVYTTSVQKYKHTSRGHYDRKQRGRKYKDTRHHPYQSNKRGHQYTDTGESYSRQDPFYPSELTDTQPSTANRSGIISERGSESYTVENSRHLNMQDHMNGTLNPDHNGRMSSWARFPKPSPLMCTRKSTNVVSSESGLSGTGTRAGQSKWTQFIDQDVARDEGSSGDGYSEVQDDVGYGEDTYNVDYKENISGIDIHGFGHFVDNSRSNKNQPSLHTRIASDKMYYQNEQSQNGDAVCRQTFGKEIHSESIFDKRTDKKRIASSADVDTTILQDDVIFSRLNVASEKPSFIPLIRTPQAVGVSTCTVMSKSMCKSKEQSKSTSVTDGTDINCGEIKDVKSPSSNIFLIDDNEDDLDNLLQI